MRCIYSDGCSCFSRLLRVRTNIPGEPIPQIHPVRVNSLLWVDFMVRKARLLQAESVLQLFDPNGNRGMSKLDSIGIRTDTTHIQNVPLWGKTLLKISQQNIHGRHSFDYQPQDFSAFHGQWRLQAEFPSIFQLLSSIRELLNHFCFFAHAANPSLFLK